MAYLVKLMPRAQRDLESLYIHIHAADSEGARAWYLGLKTAILDLRHMPNRNPVTPENKKLRQLLYGRKPYVYRVIFRVKSETQLVEVLHVRHGARRYFASGDLQ